MDVIYKENEIMIRIRKDMAEIEKAYFSKFDGASVELDKDIDGDMVGLTITKKNVK